MSEGMSPSSWSGMDKPRQRTVLERKEEKEPFPQFADRFDSQAEAALENNLFLVGGVMARLKNIKSALTGAVDRDGIEKLKKVCQEVARQNAPGFSDTLDDVNPGSLERAGLVLALARLLIAQKETIH
ncbi:MAG TPA: hypothetical protein VMU13_01830 [Candidatus Paceibacterota bacterium]|nr:hypothetical protein [Candidatus Paceibacterota bacterium]